MKQPSNISLRSTLYFLTLFCAILLAILGGVVLLGWAVGNPYISSLWADSIPMAPSSAVMFTLSAVAIVLRMRWEHTASRAAKTFGVAISLAGGIIALVLLFLSYNGIYFDVEHPGILHVFIPGAPPIGHMSPVSAACFAVAFLSYLLLVFSSEETLRANLAWGLAGVLTAFGFFMLLMYLFGMPILYGSSLVPPAALTSIAFVVLGFTLMGLSAPYTWLIRYNSSVRAGYMYVLIFIPLAVSIIAIGYVSYNNFKIQFRDQAGRQLSAIADLKVKGLENWRKERLADAELIYKNPAFSNLAVHYLKTPQDSAARKEILNWLGKYQAFDQYDHVRLINTHGFTLASIPSAILPLGSPVIEEIPKALQTREITFVDFYRDEHDGNTCLLIFIPIQDESQSGRVIGFVTLRINPHKYLYPYISRWPITSKTAETLIVRRDGNEILFLNELRFNPSAALTLRMPLTRTELPAVKAIVGKPGVVEGTDYRGVPVLADVRPVPDSRWFLVSKVDRDEIYAPLNERLWQTFGTIIMAILVLGVGLATVWRQQRINFYRTQAESAEALRESEERFRAMVENSGDALTLIGADGRVIYEGPTVQRLTGYSSQDRMGRNGLANVHPDDLDFVRGAFGKVISTPGSSESAQFRSVRKDGTIWWTDATATNMLNNPAVRSIVVNYRDVTERKRAEEELLHHLSELKVLYENGLAISALREPREIGAKIVETLSNNLSWHHIAVRLRRGDTDELELIALSQPGLTDSDAAEVEERLNSMIGRIGQGLSGWSVQTRLPLRTGNVWEYPQYVDTYPGIRSGLYMPLMISERAIGSIAVESEQENAFTEQDERLLATLAAQTTIALENARLYQNLHLELQERMRAEAEILQLNASLEQRVKERTQELRDAQEQLVRQERLATLGQLAGSIGHELRNPLGVISNAVYFLKAAQPNVSDRIREYLDIIENETRTSDKIITDLLDFTRIKSIDRKAASVPDLLRKMLERYPAPESVRVEIDTPDSLPQVYADPQHVVQILGNLTLNAFQAMPMGGTLVFSSQTRDDMVRISVQDMGMGIKPENIHKVFEPLFSTKTTGIGLGLAVSQKLAEANGGRIEVESDFGKGSTFTLYLPAQK